MGGRGALEPAILKALSPGAQTIPMVVFSKFGRWSPWSPEKNAMQPRSTGILHLGAWGPLKDALETRSPRSLRGPVYSVSSRNVLPPGSKILTAENSLVLRAPAKFLRFLFIHNLMWYVIYRYFGKDINLNIKCPATERHLQNLS